MKNTVILFFMGGILFGLAGFALAVDERPVQVVRVTPIKEQARAEIQELDQMTRRFEHFAVQKVKDLNRLHHLSRSRMQITQQADGAYHGLYHQIDESSLTVNVRRSSSRTVPFVGVLSYRENIFEATAETQKQLKECDFNLVQVVPNRHLFSYSKGHWQ
ncbi:MAG: hypothetical protein C0622_12870 [Desulfuromonas sp.]|nr:MAG: hypothetical protein C0622_12870 [Desulfuromonas sp.]